MTPPRINKRLAAQLERDPRFRAALRDAAKPVQEAAEAYARQAGAPWMPRRGHRLVETSPVPGGYRLTATDYLAHLQEWGSVNNPAHAPLRRGVRSAGLNFRSAPKPTVQ